MAGMIGTISASAASKTFSETRLMLGGQSRKTYSYSLKGLITRFRRFVFAPSSARSMWR